MQAWHGRLIVGGKERAARPRLQLNLIDQAGREDAWSGDIQQVTSRQQHMVGNRPGAVV
jgi:hypothetical protein